MYESLSEHYQQLLFIYFINLCIFIDSTQGINSYKWYTFIKYIKDTNVRENKQECIIKIIFNIKKIGKSYKIQTKISNCERLSIRGLTLSFHAVPY